MSQVRLVVSPLLHSSNSMSYIRHSCSPILQVFLITMLTVITWNQDSEKLHQCPREKSSIVREVIIKKLIPIFEREKVLISKDCPFHLDRDYLWWPLADEKSATSGWCPVCGIDFVCTERLTVHWDEEHRESYPKEYRDDLVCLADYCDIFRCDVLLRKRMQLKRAQNLMGYFTFGNEKTASCDADKMDLLEQSCRNVVRQCTVSLEANVSAEQFNSVESELTSQICSYLTCERYNDDLLDDDNASRKVPIALFSVLGFIMASGFCICYYLIWTLIQHTWLVTFADRQTNQNEGSENKLKQSFVNVDKLSNVKSDRNLVNINNKTNQFFENIFEFSNDPKEGTFEFNEFNSNSAEYERKLRSISSIIEEEEEEKDNSDISDHDISYNSYPIVGRKFAKRSFNVSRSVINERNANLSSHENQSSSLIASTHSQLSGRNSKSYNQLQKKNQEVHLQDFPVKIHPKYIQPLKHSFSDRGYPCYSGPGVKMASTLATKSRSFSHSQLRNTQNYVRVMSKPRRQDSIEEEWEQKSDHSHSSVSIKSCTSGSNLNGRSRQPNVSSLSYNVVPTVHDEAVYHFGPSSASNSNMSLSSRVSMASRLTSNSSSQAFTKR